MADRGLCQAVAAMQSLVLYVALLPFLGSRRQFSAEESTRQGLQILRHYCLELVLVILTN